MQRTPTNSGNKPRNSQPSSSYPPNRTDIHRSSQAQLTSNYLNYGGYMPQAASFNQQSGATNIVPNPVNPSSIPIRSNIQATSISSSDSIYTPENIYSSQAAVNTDASQHMNIGTLTSPATASSSYSTASGHFSPALAVPSHGVTARVPDPIMSSAPHSSGAVHSRTHTTFTTMTTTQSTSYAFPEQSNAYVSPGSGVRSTSDAFIGNYANSPVQSLNVGASTGFAGVQGQPSLATAFVPSSNYSSDIAIPQYGSGLIDPTELARRYDLDAIAEREKANAERAKSASNTLVSSSAPSLTSATTSSSHSQARSSQSTSLQFITEDPTSMARVVASSPGSHRIDPQARLRDTNKSPCARCKRSHIKCNMSAPYSSDLCEACAKKKLRVCEGGPQFFDI